VDERDAQLVAAAEALRAWVHCRRDTWTDQPLAVPVPRPRPAPISAPAPVVIAPVDEPPVHDPAPWAQPAPALLDYDSPEDDWFTGHAPDAFDELPEAPPPAMPTPVLAPQFSLPSISIPKVSIPRVSMPVVQVLASAAAWLKPVVITTVVLACIVGIGLSARSYWNRLPAAPKTGNVLFETMPADSQVFMDGKPLGDTPLTAELPAGRHTVEFRRGKTTRAVEIDVVAGGSTVGRVDWTAKRTGRLRVSSDPSGARVLVDGKFRGSTPLELDDVVAGSHAVVLETAKGSVRRSVVVGEDQVAEVSESIYSGWAHVSTPFEVTISERGTALRLDDRNQIMLTPGVHTLQFENKALGYRQVHQVDVKPGATSSVAIVPPLSSITITSTVPAEVLIDGERVGEAPITDRPIAIGTRDIVVRSAPGTERKLSVTVTTQPMQVSVDFPQ
jgi:hypothetical protein